MKARDPISKRWFLFVDKCLPFGSSASCKIFQDFSDCLAHLVQFRTGKRKKVTNYYRPLSEASEGYVFTLCVCSQGEGERGGVHIPQCIAKPSHNVVPYPPPLPMPPALYPAPCAPLALYPAPRPAPPLYPALRPLPCPPPPRTPPPQFFF